MHRTRSQIALVAIALFAAFTLVGCGGKKPVVVKGKLLPPQGVTFAEDDQIELRFASADSEKKGGAANVNGKDTSFTLKSLTPGKYKVVVTVTPYAGKPGNDKRARDFEQFNVNMNEKNTKLTVDVTDKPEQNITVDLAKGAVSNN